MTLPKFVLADNSDFLEKLFVIHLEYPRFIIDIETEDIEFLETLDPADEGDLEKEMEYLMKEATEFYEREIKRLEEE